ncbi:MAG: diguanylate cyclase [Gammaproteobacteria bacterium]|nr:diguanylate cyclase [Gammaproteobacteria bacterium]
MGNEIKREPAFEQFSNENTREPRLFDIFYSTGVFAQKEGDTEAAIDEVVRTLRPEDRLCVAASIRKIVRKHSEDALRRVEDRMQLAQEVGRIGCYEIDMHNGTSVGTPAFFKLYGLPGNRGSWTQHEWLGFIHPDDRENVITHLKQVATGAELTTLEYRVVRADGEVRWTASRARIETAADGGQVRAYGIQQDITERKLAEIALAESEEQHRHFIEVNPAYFWTADPAGKITVANSAAARGFEISSELGAVLTGPPLVHPEDRVRVMAEWRRSLADGTPYDVEHRMRLGDDAYRWVHARAYPRMDQAGEIMGWYGATEDIHERKSAEQRMSWMATHDSLTGLANRLHFRNQLENEIEESRGERQVALLLLDLDGFKLVNDTFGHDVGDELLVETARRLRELVGPHGFVARLGGDEFTIVLPRLQSEAWLGDFTKRILEELYRPLLVHGVTVDTRASIGVAIYPEDDATVADLFKDADLALYAAKSQGRGCSVRFGPELRDQPSSPIRSALGYTAFGQTTAIT